MRFPEIMHISTLKNVNNYSNYELAKLLACKNQFTGEFGVEFSENDYE